MNTPLRRYTPLYTAGVVNAAADAALSACVYATARLLKAILSVRPSVQ